MPSAVPLDESNNFTEIEDPFFERGSRQGEADLKPQWLVLQSAFECALPVEMVRHKQSSTDRFFSQSIPC